jgi:hypothetical protein
VWRIYQNQLYIIGFTNGGCGGLGGGGKGKEKWGGKEEEKKYLNPQLWVGK